MIKIITAPAAEPLTLEEVKLNLRIVDPDEDDDISRMIRTARQMAEERLNRALMPQVLAFAVSEFPTGWPCYDSFGRVQPPPALVFPRPPVRAVDSVTYTDANGAQQVLAPTGYLVDTFSDPATISAAYGAPWPATRAQAGAVVVQYQAGYADAASVPEPIRQWMLLAIGAFYENRAAVGIEQTFALPDDFAKWLLQPYVVYQ